MSENRYKELFENKFTVTHGKRRNFIEKIYYRYSSATYNERVLFDLLRRAVGEQRNLKIIDLGCGGGHRELTDFGQIYGVDISTSSLENANEIYFEVKEVDLTQKLPYPDACFDVAFCSEVLGHIAEEDKEGFLAEIARVVKPNGIAIFSVETLGDNILTHFLKKHGVFQKYWINYQGHIGLETPDDTVKRIGNHMKVEKVVPTSKSLLPVDGYLIFSDQLAILKIIKSNFIRRILNVFEYPLFLLSLKTGKFCESNDLVILGRL